MAYGTKRRTKKIRNPIRVKERIAKKGGRCAACRLRFEAGSEVTVVNIKRRTYHRHTCVPANVGMPQPSGGVGASAMTTAADVGTAMSIKWTQGEAEMVGLLAFENALAVKLKRQVGGITDAQRTEYKKYNARKNMALRPGSENEGRQAMMAAIISLVRLVYSN
jgi:hypothetical protein